MRRMGKNKKINLPQRTQSSQRKNKFKDFLSVFSSATSAVYTFLYLEKGLFFGLILAILFALSTPCHAWVEDIEESEKEEYARAEILGVVRLDESEFEERFGESGAKWAQGFRLRIKGGRFDGEVVLSEVVYFEDNPYEIDLKIGDRVILDLTTTQGKITEAYIQDYDRTNLLYLLLGLFLLAVAIIGRRKGLLALLSLLVTICLIYFILIPLTLKGYSPILIGVLVCLASTIITLPLIAGLRLKALAAILGTGGGLIAAGLTCIIFGRLMHLSGIGHDSASLYYVLGEKGISLQGILFAGIIIGALGAVMDVAVSLASSGQEIRRANPEIDFLSLYRSLINIGRDLLGTMANTLILAYAGSSLSLILLIFAQYNGDIPYLKIINLDLIASEIIRGIAGSLGIFVTIPLTALIASLLYTKGSRQ